MTRYRWITPERPRGFPVEAACLCAGAFSMSAFGRGGTPELGFDAIAYAEIRQSLDARIHLYVLDQVFAITGTVTASGSFTRAKFFQELALAGESLTDPAGTHI